MAKKIGKPDRSAIPAGVVAPITRQKINLTLSPATIARAREAGHGIVSRGIDTCVKYYYERINRAK